MNKPALDQHLSSLLPRLQRAARAIAGDMPHLADDLVQQAVVIYLEQAPTAPRHTFTFLKWRMKNFARGQRLRASQTLPDECADQAETLQAVEEQWDQQRLVIKLLEIEPHLKPEQRRALEAVRQTGTARAAARTLRCSRQNVTRHLRIIKEQLLA